MTIEFNLSRLVYSLVWTTFEMFAFCNSHFLKRCSFWSFGLNGLLFLDQSSSWFQIHGVPFLSGLLCSYLHRFLELLGVGEISRTFWTLLWGWNWHGRILYRQMKLVSVCLWQRVMTVNFKWTDDPAAKGGGALEYDYSLWWDKTDWYRIECFS